MKTLYKHVHLVIDDKREYLDGSLLINDGIIEDVFVQSNKSIEDAKEIEMRGKIFIPSFFDSKSKKEKQKGIIKKYCFSSEKLDEPTHLYTDDEIKDLRNVAAVTRINKYSKVNSIKTFINPDNERNIFADGVSDITKLRIIDFDSNKMINYAIENNCFIEFGIDKSINDDYIKFILKNIDSNKIILVSYDHDDILKQIERLFTLGVSLTDIVAMTSINPYKFYGSNKQDGYLIKGKPANIVCLNEDMGFEFALERGEKDV